MSKKKTIIVQATLNETVLFKEHTTLYISSDDDDDDNQVITEDHNSSSEENDNHSAVSDIETEDDENEDEDEDIEILNDTVTIPVNPVETIPVKIQDDKTFMFLSTYERAKILGLRVTQLVNGVAPMISGRYSTMEEIAEAELKKGVIPFKIKRNLPNGKCHIVSLKDLIIKQQ